MAAAVELKERHGFPVTPAAVERGVHRTIWPGRLERICRGGVEWILDVAHNPAGAWALRGGLRDALEIPTDQSRPRVLVFSCLRDKPVAELAQILFPLFDKVIFTPIHSPRATPADDLLAAAQATGTPAVAAESVAEALELARSAKATAPNPTGAVIVISGSVYLVGEARGLIMSDTRHSTGGSS